MTSTWQVTILPGEDFRSRANYLKMNTDSAYTFLQLRQTYVNEDFLIYANDVRIRQMMAHEAGHLICECSSEEKANEIAYQLQFGK
jgi:predicted SprT family Zn-dependent metalloprotease